jgi:hypothetical protein
MELPQVRSTRKVVADLSEINKFETTVQKYYHHVRLSIHLNELLVNLS